MKKLLLLIGILLMVQGISFADAQCLPKVSTLLSMMSTKDAKIKSYKADFITLFRDPLRKWQEVARKGRIFYVAPDKLRTEVVYPQEQVIIKTSTAEYSLNVSGDKTVRDDVGNMIPPEISDPPALKKYFHYKLTNLDDHTYLLTGLPKNEEGSYSSKEYSKIIFEIDKFTKNIQKIELYAKDNELFLTTKLNYLRINDLYFPEKITSCISLTQGEVAIETVYSSVELNSIAQEDIFALSEKKGENDEKDVL